MQDTIQSDLIRGHINTIILKALFEGDRYGYDIVKEIEQKSGGQYKLKQPTLYSCLKRLEVQGFIRSYWGAKSNGGRRKYFTLTDMGKELFLKNQSEWEYSRTVIDKLISDKEYDLSRIPIYSENDTQELGQTLDIAESIQAEENDTTALLSDKEMFDILNKLKAQNETLLQDIKVQENNLSDEKNDSVKADNYPIENFLDTSLILNQLFSEQNKEKSYVEKIIDEKVEVNTNKVASSSYFKDYTDIDEEENEASNEDDLFRFGIVSEEVNLNSNEKFPILEKPQSYAISNIKEQDASSNEIESLNIEKEKKSDFISYNKKLSSNVIDKKDIIEREYRNVLGNLFSGQDLNIKEEKSTAVSLQPATIPISKEMQVNNERIQSNINEIAIKEEDFFPVPTITREPSLNENLNKMTEEVKYYTGDTLKTRIHNGSSAVEFNTQYHYYSNKLMLIHYAILFAIMLVEIIFTFLLVRVGMKITSTRDTVIYILAIVLTCSFPIYAAIKNSIDPNKTKRIEFDFKNSIIFRFSIASCCLIITYCINIFLQMPISFSSDYIASLLLPALLCLNFPVSSVIFYLLYSSGKYNQIY